MQGFAMRFIRGIDTRGYEQRRFLWGSVRSPSLFHELKPRAQVLDLGVLRGEPAFWSFLHAVRENYLRFDIGSAVFLWPD
jgi:hypothetical protein